MNTKIRLSIIIVGLCLATSVCYATPSGTSPCSSRKQQAMKKMVDGAAEVYDQTIEMPDLNFIEKCLQSIRQPQFGFGMGFPSIQGIMSQVCNMMKSQIDSATSGLNYNFDMNGFGNGFGSGLSTRTISYSGNAGSFGDQLSKSVGSSVMSSVGSSVTQSLGLGSSAAQSGSTATGTGGASNSSYMNNTVNSAMQYLTGGK
jgi:hypothetical protein